MKSKLFKRVLSVLSALTITVGLVPVSVLAVPSLSSTGGKTGKSAENPILIDSMDELIEEMEKDVTAPTYYKLTEDVSHETSIEYFDGREDHTGDDGYTTVRKPEMAQCVVGTGKKFLELDGYDVHYKNNVNFNLGDDNSKYWGSGPKYDSLTFFYLGEGSDLTVTNSTGDDAEVWYDGWMHNRTNFFGGPNYIYTAVRDVFRVESGAELTVNNTDIKAGRNRKVWMVHSYYTDKEGETNLLASLTYNGYAYEQIYGSAIVANGGKVTINGGYIEGRGGYRNAFNVSGVPDWNKDSIADMVWGGDFTRDAMIENCLSNVGGKAAVQIAGEGSTVIINDGEFWGCGGADVIGINGLNGGSVKEYTLRINAGTFDTSKTDKERLPDRTAGVVNSGPWPWSHGNWMLWANCRCIRDTLRGNIGIPAVDGYGERVFDMNKVHVYIDDEENEVTYNDKAYNEELDFRRKSDSDTIIVKPIEEKSYWSTSTHTWHNYADRSHYDIYAYLDGEIVAQTPSSGMLYHGSTVNPTLFFSAESHFDMTDEDNPYFDRAHIVNCIWTLYEEDENGDLINSYDRVTAPFKAEHIMDEEYGVGHTVYNFKISMSSFTGFSDVNMVEDHTYYVVARMEEFFYGKLGSDYHRPLSYMTGVLDDMRDGNFDGANEFYYNSGLEIVYGQSLATCGAEVVYSSAVYGSDPVLTFNDAFNEMKAEGTEIYQWQVLEDDEWVDYGKSRISPELAVEVLMGHEDLVGEQVRLKITPEYGDERPIYSNVCTVQKETVTEEPNTGTHSWSEDPKHPGKYILKSVYHTDMQEFLLQPYDGTWDRSTLDWSKAKDEPYFDNLDRGYYYISTRFKATDESEAGTLINYEKVAVGPFTALVGTDVIFEDEPVGEELMVEVGQKFTLSLAPIPADSTSAGLLNGTQWVPESGKSGVLVVNYRREIGPFREIVIGGEMEFVADSTGTMKITTITPVSGGSKVVGNFTVRVVPEGFVPYTVSVMNSGTEVMEGGSYTPALRMHALGESELSESKLGVPKLDQPGRRPTTSKPILDPSDILISDIRDRLQSQLLASKMSWTLTDGRISQVDRTTVTNGKADINVNSGKITLNDTAKPGDVIRFVGLLEDPYIGRIEAHGYFKVVAAPELEPHTCNYEGYAVNGSTGHYRVCECGNKKTEPHSITKFTSEATDQTVIQHVCPCGFSYSQTVVANTTIHTHTLEYVYDDNDHWEICTDEDCPGEYSTSHQAHSFVTVTDGDGREGNVCSVCGCVYSESEPDTSTSTGTGTGTGIGRDIDIETVNPYTDIKADDWYYKDVMYVTDKKLMNGNNVGGTLFDPDTAAARAMIVTVLWRLEGSPTVAGMKFDDVPSGQWYTDAVNWASANGIVNGYGNGKFGPSDPITREQLLAILHRYASHVGTADGTELAVPNGYHYSEWAKGSVTWTAHKGLLDGLGIDVSDLLVTATRAEIAAYLHRFCENVLEY